MYIVGDRQKKNFPVVKSFSQRFSARHAVDTRAERLWNYIITQFEALGEGGFSAVGNDSGMCVGGRRGICLPLAHPSNPPSPAYTVPCRSAHHLVPFCNPAPWHEALRYTWLGSGSHPIVC